MTATGAQPLATPTLGHAPAAVTLTCEVSPVLDFAMEQNGVPVLREIVVANRGPDALEGAVIDVTVEPGLSSPLRLTVPPLASAEEHRVRPVDVPLTPGKLREITEAELGEVLCRVVHRETVLAEHRGPIRVLAFNEWPGAAAPPGLLAAFVLPNHPVVSVLLQAAREELRTAGLPDGIDGYQNRDRKRVLALVTAFYRAAQALGIGYVSAPPSFERTGQKIRLPDTVLRDRLGCCLDLTVLFAAALEQMGLAPLLFLVREHAFVGVWLEDERFPEGVVEDAARLRTLIDLGQVLPIEATSITSAAPVPFEDSVACALEKLKDDPAFGCAIDVRAVRTEYRPLPVRAVRAPLADGPAAAAPEHAAAVRVLAQAAAIPIREEAPPPPLPAPDVAIRFRRWKEKLLDLTLRNRLLNFRVDGRGALQLEVPDLATLENGVFAGRSFDVLPRPRGALGDERDPELAKRRVEDTAQKRRLDDLRRGVLHSRYGADELWTRLKHLDREARIALEEGGAAILHLAIGFLRWHETPASEQPLVAPLLLYPVELSFDARVRRARFRRLAEEPLLNVTLLEKLRRDYAVDTGELEALPMEETEDAERGVDVPLLLRRFREAVQRIPRWEVLEDAHLGLFHFTKFLMWKDLDANAEKFLANPVVRRIASRDLVPLEQGPLVDPSEVDGRDPCELPTVLDADSTQLAAIASALDGKNFVLQGPPGTGKSQTIANLIAAALAHAKSVLFVSEKMAALEVVQRRLRDVGLADFCLEIHSHKANKREVVESLKTALEHGARTPLEGWKEHGERLRESRAALDRYVEALHRPGPFGPSVYEVRSGMLALEGAPTITLSSGFMDALDSVRLENARKSLQEFTAVALTVEPVAVHPFRKILRTEWSTGVEEDLRTALAGASEAIASWEASRRNLATETGADGLSSARAEDLTRVARAAALPSGVGPAATPEWPRSSARLKECVSLRRAAHARASDLGLRWEGGFRELDHGPLIHRFERWGAAFFLLAWVALWGARRRLRRVARGKLGSSPEVLSDLRAAAELRSWNEQLRIECDWAATLLGTEPNATEQEWESSTATLDEVRPALLRLGTEGASTAAALQRLAVPLSPERRRSVISAGEKAAGAALRLREAESRLGALLTLPDGGLPSWEAADHTEAFVALLGRWATGLRTFRSWCLYRQAGARLAAAKLTELTIAHEDGTVKAAKLAAAFEHAVFRQWHSRAVDAEPVLRDFDAEQHTHRVARFRQLDREHLIASRRHVAAMLESRLPSLAATRFESSEPAIIMREAQKKTRHLPTRKLLAQLPATLRKLKPCFLMSPLSVAQYLPAESDPFDLVVFDEASQICTHDAIGAIARGRQVIVVGDSRQLPPTSFFTRTDSEEGLPDENDVVELESVLDESVAKLIPQQWLNWHYRSRHESLIDFSNRHIYESRLEIFPAAEFRSDDVGIHWHRVDDGVYQGGSGKGGRTNRREAEALVSYLVDQLRRRTPEERTFGVVTFNLPQAMLVLDLLDEARADPLVDRHFAGLEPPFVKNLENVQGDERDEILFSICLAPDATGRFTVSVGALGMAGGERRLNVAITRARRKLVVFSSIEPERIDRSRSKARGIWLLRDFLLYARDGRRAEEGARTRRPNGAFEQRIGQRLAAEGWQADNGIGCGGYRLDLAVRDPVSPGRYAVAVETDGAAYRAARTTRDRDRLRADVLSSLGWRLERVWSSAWWFDERAPDRLVERVRSALVPQPAAPSAPAARLTAPAAALQPKVAIPPGVFAKGPSPATPSTPPATYRNADLAVPHGSPDDFFLGSMDEGIRSAVLRVVEIEGPIHERLLARRVIEHWGIERLTARPARRVSELVEQLAHGHKVKVRGEFVWPASLHPVDFAAYRVPARDNAPRDLPSIPPEEVANAAAAILKDSGSLDRDALGREIARTFGIQRMGANVRECIDRGIDVLVSNGRAEVKGDRVQLR